MDTGYENYIKRRALSILAKRAGVSCSIYNCGFYIRHILAPNKRSRRGMGAYDGLCFRHVETWNSELFWVGADKISSPEILAFIGDFNPYYAAGVIFAFSSAALIAASLATAEPPKEKLKGLTYAWLMSDSEARAEIAKSWSLSNKILAASVFGGVAVCYLYFSFWLG